MDALLALVEADAVKDAGTTYEVDAVTDAAGEGAQAGATRGATTPGS